MYTKPTQPQAIGGILDSGIKLFTGGVKKILPLTLTSALIGAVWSWYMERTMLAAAGETGVPELPDTTTFLWTFFTAFALLMIVNTVLWAAIIRMIDAVANDGDASYGSAFSGGIRRALPLIAASILYTIAFTVALLLLIVPGLYFGVTLAFCFFACVADKKGPVESLQFSHSLVKGNYWRTAGVMTIMLFIGAIFYVGLGFLAAMFTLSGDPAEPFASNALFDFLISPVLIAIVTALMYSIAYSVYDDLKLRREGTDLADRIDQLAEA